MARNKDIVTRSVACPNEHCGSTVYEKDYARDEANNLVAMWKCCNCLRETPRKRVYRRNNHQRAMQLWRAIRDEWKPTDEALRSLIDQGIVKNGAMMVHDSTFSYHLGKLFTKEYPSNFDVRYHAEQARKELAKARAFVAEEKEKSCSSSASFLSQTPSS